MSTVLSDKKNDALIFEGAQDFRLRIVLSTLSGKAIEIRGIHANDSSVGIKGKFFINIYFKKKK